jgi:hypothetical protein
MILSLIRIIKKSSFLSINLISKDASLPPNEVNNNCPMKIPTTRTTTMIMNRFMTTHTAMRELTSMSTRRKDGCL